MSANGYLSSSELAPIDNGQYLTPAAAPRYLALRDAAHAAGHPFSALEGYRDIDTQWYLWNLYGSPRASYPGSSPHGWGYAVDIMNDSDPQGIIRFKDPLYNWLAANAGDYGFNNRVGISINEPWHWVFDGSGTAGVGYSAFPEEVVLEEEEDEMRVIAEYVNGVTTEVALIDKTLQHPNGNYGYLTAKGNTDIAAAWLRTYAPKGDGVPHARLTSAQYVAAIEAAKQAGEAHLRFLRSIG